MTKDSQQSYQYIYIDDSGDPGFKFGQNSSDFLVIAGVFIDQQAQISAIHSEISDFRKSLRRNMSHEFKFHRMSDDTRIAFLRKIVSLKMTILVHVSDKRLESKLSASDLYNKTILSVVAGATGDNLRVYIDGESGRNYRRNVKTYFRKALPDKKIKSLNYIDSEKSDLIQIADCVVGAVAAYYNKQNGRYLKIIKKYLAFV